MHNNFRLLAIVLLFKAGPVFAEDFEPSVEVIEAAPVVDIAADDHTASFATDIADLKQQVESLKQQNIISKVKQLQNEIQELRGAIDIEAHNVAKLKEELGVKNTQVTAQNSKKETAPKAVKNTTSEIESYNNAFAILKDRDYDGATKAFSEFLVSFPEGKYSPNANYWLGEIYLLKGNYKNAELSFKTIIDQYPSHGKTPDAMFKLAMVYVNTNEVAKAKELVSKLEKDYPDTTAYRMAKIQLRNI